MQATFEWMNELAVSALIRESIWIVLSTSKGERVMRRDFGCGIHDLVFEVVNTTALMAIEESVREALATFEPRIEVQHAT